MRLTPGPSTEQGLSAEQVLLRPETRPPLCPRSPSSLGDIRGLPLPRPHVCTEGQGWRLAWGPESETSLVPNRPANGAGGAPSGCSREGASDHGPRAHHSGRAAVGTSSVLTAGRHHQGRGCTSETLLPPGVPEPTQTQVGLCREGQSECQGPQMPRHSSVIRTEGPCLGPSSPEDRDPDCGSISSPLLAATQGRGAHCP